MSKMEMIIEQTPIHITHDTYKRECRYTRGIHIPVADFELILSQMSPDTKAYFDFHNSAKPITEGSYLNGHSSLAKQIVNFYKSMKDIEVVGLNNGKDFYVKII